MLRGEDNGAGPVLLSLLPVLKELVSAKIAVADDEAGNRFEQRQDSGLNFGVEGLGLFRGLGLFKKGNIGLRRLFRKGGMTRGTEFLTGLLEDLPAGLLLNCGKAASVPEQGADRSNLSGPVALADRTGPLDPLELAEARGLNLSLRGFSSAW